MDKKYEILKESATKYGDLILYRIRALKDFGDVKTGDIGGYIEKEDNLSHEGNCWVYDNAEVYNSAKVFGDARVYGSAEVFDRAKVYNSAEICASAKIYNNAKVYGYAEIYGNAEVYGHAEAYGNARIFDNAEICASARIYNNVKVFGDARVYGSAEVFDRAKVYDNARVYGNTKVYGNARICMNANISDKQGYIIISNIGSRYDITTFFLCEDNTIGVTCGCFKGTLEEFEAKVKETHGDNKYGRDYMCAIEMAKVHFKDIIN